MGFYDKTLVKPEKKYSTQMDEYKLIFANKFDQNASDFVKFLKTQDLDLTKNLHIKKINIYTKFCVFIVCYIKSFH